MAARVMDAETRAIRDDHGAIRLWLRMLATNRLVETRTRRLLQEHYATTLPRFDLMAQLERSPQGLRLAKQSKVDRHGRCPGKGTFPNIAKAHRFDSAVEDCRSCRAPKIIKNHEQSTPVK